jgi:hypothetical protein
VRNGAKEQPNKERLFDFSSGAMPPAETPQEPPILGADGTCQKLGIEGSARELGLGAMLILNEAPRYLIRDRDRVYGAAVTRRFRAMGIRDKPIAPGSPWQNGFAERLIGSIRRECVDHIVVLGEEHLRRILTKYAAYYNELRTHRSLDKDAPIHRAIQHVGRVISAPVLGGLHHYYCRI